MFLEGAGEFGIENINREKNSWGSPDTKAIDIFSMYKLKLQSPQLCKFSEFFIFQGYRPLSSKEIQSQAFDQQENLLELTSGQN